MAKTVVRNASQAFVEYYALQGSFGKVQYFATKATLRDVAENLELAPQMELSFGDRIQRVLNEKRVHDEIVPYLLENELRFFNALVCILLPDRDGDAAIWNFEEFVDEDGAELGGLGKLKIAKNVARVVLDGQHRFVALRELWKQAKNDPSGEDASIEVSLIFVVVEDLGKIGVKQKAVRSKTIAAVRNLFAVLNKTARRVDNTTLLLIDDSDITNVMTRNLLETEAIEERLVKWTGGEQLNPTDVFYTGIHVIRDAISWYLRDHSDQTDKEYGTQAEREEAMRDLFYDTPGVEMPTERVVPVLVNELACCDEWKKLIRKHKVEISQQPGKTELLTPQSKAIAAARKSSLMYTVAGQKALFRAVIDAFRDEKRQTAASLRRVIGRANALLRGKCFARSVDNNNPYFGILVGTRGKMMYSEAAVDLARRIFAVAIGSTADRDSILAKYEEHTELDGATVEAYWKTCRAKWRQRK